MSPGELLATPAARERGRTYGVLVGVVADNKDPQGLGRVKLKLPGLSDQEIGHWARVATLMAGAQRGTFFLPEVNDEVLVAFEQGDMSRPYVLGSLWNGVDKPPAENPDGKNNLRLIRSKSGHVVRLDDTEGSEKIEILDKSGENSISVETARSAITVKAAKDIRVEGADGTVTLTNGQGRNTLTIQAERGQITIKAAVKTIVEAPQIELVEGGTHPAVYGDQLLTYLNQLVTMFNTHLHPGELALGIFPVTPAPPVPPAPPASPALLSPRVKTG